MKSFWGILSDEIEILVEVLEAKLRGDYKDLMAIGGAFLAPLA